VIGTSIYCAIRYRPEIGEPVDIKFPLRDTVRLAMDTMTPTANGRDGNGSTLKGRAAATVTATPIETPRRNCIRDWPPR